MSKHKNKLSKLRELKCVICRSIFHRHISISEIESGKGILCSRECINKYFSIRKTKSFPRKCVYCGKEFLVRPSEDRRGYTRKYCSKYCYLPVEAGKAISNDGYFVFNGKKIHRLIMERHIGRKLLPTEIVHHINDNKFDNRIENLQIVSRSEHNKMHKPKINDGLTNKQRFDLRRKEARRDKQKKETQGQKSAPYVSSL